MKYVCSECGGIIEPIDDILPRNCPNCSREFMYRQWRCLGNKCKGEVTIVETVYRDVKECIACFSKEVFEVEKPIPLAVPIEGV